MIKVECVSCKSPYDVDERRVPDLGMKMRCPKCGTSFLVGKDGSAVAVGTTSLGTGAAAPPPVAAAIAPPPTAGGNFKKTLVGGAIPGPVPVPPPSIAQVQAPAGAQVPPPKANLKGTMVGMQSPTAPAPLQPSAAGRQAPDLSDLPAVKPPPKPAVPWGSLAPPAPDAKGAPRPSVQAQLPKGAMGAPSGSFGDSQGAQSKAGSAASAFGAPTSPMKKTMIGSAATGFDSSTDLPALKPKAPNAPPVGLAAPVAAAPHAELDFDEVDLPAPKLEVDLPAPKLAAKPAAKIAPPAPAFGEVDLPAPKLEVDLPAPKFKQREPKGGGFGDLDLPTPKGVTDLPTPKGVTDLPTPKGFADLPTPKNIADLPVRAGQQDLPTPKSGGGFGDLDLPVPKPGAGLSYDEASFGDIELPDLPPALDNSGGLGFGDIELPPPRAAAGVIPPKEPTVQGHGYRAAAATQDESSFGDLNAGDSLPPSLMGGEDETSFGDINPDEDVLAIPAAPRPPTPTHAEYGGSIPPALMGDDEGDEDDLMSDGDVVDDDDGDDLGEAELSDGEEGEASEEDMEFGIAEGEVGEDGFSLPPEMLRRQRGEDADAAEATRGKRAIHMVAIVAAVLVVLGGGGAALGFTDYGFFGIYYLERYLPEAGDPIFTREAIARAEKTAVTDTYRDVRRSLSLLGEARRKAGLSRELLARSLMHEAFFLTRFGDTGGSGHVAPLVLRLQERHNIAPGIELALAADAARRQAWGEVDGLVAKARALAPNDPYVDLIAGEVALKQAKLVEAEKAFGEALKHGGGARAQWGLARVALARTDIAVTSAAVEETLKLSPRHVEARIAHARLLWGQGKEDRAITELRQALGLEPLDDQFLWTSKPALAQGFSVLGYIHEARGRLHLARKAYDQALAADPYLVEALLGAGRVMLREKRHNEALARFESALNIAQKTSNPPALSGRKADVEARLGQGRAQLALIRVPEAKNVLSTLMNENPNDAEIILAVGQAEEKLGNMEPAETLYKKSMDLAPSSFAGYLALSQFYFKQNKADKASETLNQAASKVEENAEMRRMLGHSELARNRLDSAVHEFKRAVELDPQDLDAKFGLAIALRKNGDLDASRTFFDEIAARDPQFAGLTLERGQLFEAAGEYAKAAESYKLALEKDSNDTSLLLRLGAAQVEGEMYDEAEQTLAKVIREIPNSADAEYFIGRIAFARGRGPDALTHFERALSLDNTIAMYHLYAARAALSMANLGRTLDEIELTMERDPNIGDAYWVRGIVRIRTGAVRDALKDLQRALVLKPSRYEAYGSMGKAYDELRMLPQSIQAYHTALDKDPKNGEWWYELGRVHLVMGATGAANDSFKKAIDVGASMDPAPYWLPEAYRLSGDIARSAGNKKLAIELFLNFLKTASDGALDRDEVRKQLKEWGVELDGYR